MLIGGHLLEGEQWDIGLVIPLFYDEMNEEVADGVLELMKIIKDGQKLIPGLDKK